jgi:hypothetical protein
MKIKWIAEVRVMAEHGIMYPGDVKDLPIDVASNLIAGGFAEAFNKAEIKPEHDAKGKNKKHR